MVRHTVTMASWGEFAKAEPELAAFGVDRLAHSPAYLATLRADGTPRVHPFTPIIDREQLFVFMEPTSPKGRDLRERRSYALHSGVPDMFGSGGEFHLSGEGVLNEDAAVRAQAVGAASYEPADRYILFVLGIREVRCNGYGDVALPAVTRWSAA
jgi:hypothetical protein